MAEGRPWGTGKRGWRWIAAAVAALWTVAAPAVADPEEGLVVHLYTLRHQPAGEAVARVYPLLSERGSIEVRAAANILVVRDTAAVVARVAELLDEYDHAAGSLRLRIRLVQAELGAPARGAPAGLPPDLVERLRELLRYDSYTLLAATDVAAREGEDVVYDLGDDYEVRFRLGTLLADRRLKLHGFRVAQRSDEGEPEPLIHTNLNLWLNKPMVLGLARAEASERALMIVLTCSPAPESP